MKTLASPILFKQIIGRGTRVDPDSGKLWFRIIDYTGASRLLDPQWDKPPTTAEPIGAVAETASLTGVVRLAETGDLLVGATIALLVGPNDQRGPILTDEDGRYHFANLPAGALTITAGGPRLLRRQLQVITEPFLETICDIALKPQGEGKTGKITVEGLEVTIADEATFVVDGINEPLTLERYLDYTRDKIVGFVPSWNKLRAIWQDAEQRRIFLTQLAQASIHAEVLAEVLQEADADHFDLLAYLAYGKPLRTRGDRAAAFRQREERWLEEQSAQPREVILALLEKYELGGLQEMTNPAVFRVSPFREMGEVRGVLKRFGGDAQQLRQALSEIQQRLYAA